MKEIILDTETTGLDVKDGHRIVEIGCLELDAILGKDKIVKSNVIDTLELARNKYPGSQNSLDALCKRYKIDNSKRVKHTALVDCELLSKVYINLTGQKEPLLKFENDYINALEKKDLMENVYCKKVVKPSENDLNLHKQFLKSSQKKNYFN